MIRNNDMKKRIIELSYKHKLSHIGSCLTAVDIIEDIYNLKKKHERFVLSQGHAGLALYVVLEKHLGLDAEQLLLESGVHPDRLVMLDENGCGPFDCTTGSLGLGLPIAVGMALANPSEDVYCLISDGEISEGSIYEGLTIKNTFNVRNLKVYINCNGYSAYGDTAHLGVPVFGATYDCAVRYTDCKYLPFLQGLDGHYHIMTEDEYLLAMEILK